MSRRRFHPGRISSSFSRRWDSAPATTRPRDCACGCCRTSTSRAAGRRSSGTGSGVLAIAAHLLGAREVEGIDVDEDALSRARGSLALNGLTGRVTLRRQTCATDRIEPADMCLANLTGALLDRAGAAARRRCSPAAGTLILSGFQRRGSRRRSQLGLAVERRERKTLARVTGEARLGERSAPSDRRPRSTHVRHATSPFCACLLQSARLGSRHAPNASAIPPRSSSRAARRSARRWDPARADVRQHDAAQRHPLPPGQRLLLPHGQRGRERRPRDGRRHGRRVAVPARTGRPRDPIGRKELALAGRPGEGLGIRRHPADDRADGVPRAPARRVRASRCCWTRLSERDEVDDSRGDKGIEPRAPVQQPAQRSAERGRGTGLETIRSRYPFYDLRDVDAAIDKLRVIKSPREIEVLKLNGRLSAEAIRTRSPSRSLAASSTSWKPRRRITCSRTACRATAIRRSSARDRTCNVWHYQDNGRQMQAGDLVVMDYGGDARLPGDRHHAHVARVGPVRRAPAARVQVRARDAEGDHRGHAAGRNPQADGARSASTSTRGTGSPISVRPRRAISSGMSVHDVGDYTEPFRAGHGHRRRADHRDPGQAPARPDRGHGPHHRGRAVHPERGGAQGSRRGARAHEERRHEVRPSSGRRCTASTCQTFRSRATPPRCHRKRPSTCFAYSGSRRAMRFACSTGAAASTWLVSRR